MKLITILRYFTPFLAHHENLNCKVSVILTNLENFPDIKVFFSKKLILSADLSFTFFQLLVLTIHLQEKIKQILWK